MVEEVEKVIQVQEGSAEVLADMILVVFEKKEPKEPL